jgi:hypothetical protein
VQSDGDEVTVQFVFLRVQDANLTCSLMCAYLGFFFIGQRGTGSQIKPLRVELTRAAKNRSLKHTSDVG